MAQYNFTVNGNQLIVTLTPNAGDVETRSDSYKQPKFLMALDKIKFSESGRYQKSFRFEDIGTIGGDTPADLQESFDLLTDLVANFSGGGGSPQNIQQVLTEGNTADDTDIVLQSTSVDRNTVFSNNGLELTNADNGVVAIINDTQIRISQGSNDTRLVPDGINHSDATGSVNIRFDAQSAGNGSVQVRDVAGGNKVMAFSTASATGSVISFAFPQIYNSNASPSTANITDSLTGAQIGIVQKIYSNKAVEPTYPAGWVKVGSGNYATSALNIIFAEWVSGTRVEYWIVQPAS